MKILFLDFDGVIAPFTYHHSSSGFSKSACANVQYILVKDPNVRIVVSSAWRRNGLEILRKILQEHGVDPTKVIDITEEKGGWTPENRDHQIKDWLKKHPEIKDFAIVDDSAVLKDFEKHYVKTNAYVGLTQQDAERVIEILNADKKT